jgi:hypothetical protein
VVSLLLLEPLRLGFITQPPKRCLPLQFIGEATAAIERVAELVAPLRLNSARQAASTSGSAIRDLSCPLRPDRQSLLPHRTSDSSRILN